MRRWGAQGSPLPTMPTPARGQEAAEQGGGPQSHSPVPTEEEGVPCGFPPDGRVDAVIGDALSIGDQGLWVPGLQVGFSEEPVPVTWRWRRWRRGARWQCPAAAAGAHVGKAWGYDACGHLPFPLGSGSGSGWEGGSG